MIKNRFYLYATAFFSGMSIMAIEMGASRLLTPYFSSSQVIWTIIIGIIMIAMAIGNVWEAARRIRIRIPPGSIKGSWSRRSGQLRCRLSADM
jgi:hypothetical protein